MLPSILARQVRTGIEDHLRASFAPSTKSFDRLIEDFIETPGALIKGPWITLEMPFRQAEADAEFFPQASIRLSTIQASGESLQKAFRGAPPLNYRRNGYGFRQN